MNNINNYAKELSLKMYKIEIMRSDIQNLIQETRSLPQKLIIQIKLKYVGLGMIISAIISILLILLIK